jgi:hypothetical protein
LTALAAFVLAGAGLAAARDGLHEALLADAGPDASVPTAGHAEHRLHAGLVAAIVAVVVVVAAVVSVAVVMSGAATHPTPPGQGGSGRIAPHSAAPAGSIHRTLGQSNESPWRRVALASNTTSLAAGTATIVNLVDGIGMTVAPGWTVTRQGQQSADLLKSDQTAGLFVNAGSANTSDIGQESTFLINQNIQASGLINVQQYPAQPQPLQGKNFKQLLEVDYTAGIQTNQGTGQIYGGWVTLYNSVTGMSGLFNLYAGTQAAFTAALTDAAQMMVSME